MKPSYIDLNSDVGEGIGLEKDLLPLISSCNVACGGHAGNAQSISDIVDLAHIYNVKVGAHPSYPDTSNFGRVSIQIPEAELIGSIREQISLLEGTLLEKGKSMHHIKAHGALYNDIAKDVDLARLFLMAVEKYKKTTFIYVPYGSEVAKEALCSGFKIKYEAFADRNYNDDLSLVSRRFGNGLITSKEEVLAHVAEMVGTQQVVTVTGKKVKILADTFCVHGDTQGALQIVLYLTQELSRLNILIEK
ncbi:5-oxoprolinase subunit PxpA [Zobellia galactanivorans]|uniref:5-oxoprolinase subunit PxpA n=1 Tax=Zobellia galactanivorans (strain DSM 12802 / CCUG 47099 / CIP 106680 / NCIMB 13871 / Dsij) TaxID=63186 RepID=UPI001C067EA9|nr:5-oxoprolinase subunit PxpA [Zobellia galactanivorans]MBU3025715.1 5-oxoprolinase subunit PxpA [Zobellia galactanivorans]